MFRSLKYLLLLSPENDGSTVLTLLYYYDCHGNLCRKVFSILSLFFLITQWKEYKAKFSPRQKFRLLRSLFARSLAPRSKMFIKAKRANAKKKNQGKPPHNSTLSIRIQAVFWTTSAKKKVSKELPGSQWRIKNCRGKRKKKLIPTDFRCAKNLYKKKVKRMSANISKWFPKAAASQKNSDKVFHRSKSIERELIILANKFTTKIEFNLLDYYVS